MITELVKSEGNYQSAFREVRHARPTAAWTELVRGSAMDRFEQLGFPTVKNEEWKYTNLAPFLKEKVKPSTPVNVIAEVVCRYAYPETVNNHLVLVNGFFSSKLSALS